MTTVSSFRNRGSNDSPISASLESKNDEPNDTPGNKITQGDDVEKSIKDNNWQPGDTEVEKPLDVEPPCKTICRMNRSKSESMTSTIIREKQEQYNECIKNQEETKKVRDDWAVIKLVKPCNLINHNSWEIPFMGEIKLKKTESQQVRRDQLPNKQDLIDDRNAKTNGKAIIDNNSEDLGVLMPLFDCIFWVANQKIVIQKILNDSLIKRVNSNIDSGYDIDQNYITAALLQFKTDSFINSKADSDTQEPIWEPTDPEVLIQKTEEVSVYCSFQRLTSQLSLPCDPPINIIQIIELHKKSQSKLIGITFRFETSGGDSTGQAVYEHWTGG